MPPWIFRIPPLKSSLINLHNFPIFAHISLVPFSTSAPKITLFDYLVNHQQFSPEFAEKVSSSSSSAEFVNNPQNADSVLNFLKEIGFAKDQIEVVVRKAPSVLSANLETSVKPKIKVFLDLGFQFGFTDIISTSPWLLGCSADRIRPSFFRLKNVLGPNADISRFLKNSGSGRYLAYDLNRTLVPNIDYLKTCGICSLQIASYVCRYPPFFLNKPEKLKVLVQRVDEMGVDRKSKMFIEAVRVMSSFSRENWELKLQVFSELGFSEQGVLVAFRRAPLVFASSETKIKDVTHLLLSVEDISYIASNPVLLTLSVEKRLKPRLRVLKALQSKNLLKKKPGMAGFLKISEAEFINKYVIPYSNELGGLYAASQDSVISILCITDSVKNVSQNSVE